VDVAVVGGGALGCSAALALAERNHQVVLHERTNLGSEATAKAAGILSTLCNHDEEYKLIAETRGLIGETIALAMAAGERAARGAWRPCASLVVAAGDGLRILDAMQDRVERFTEEAQRMDHREAAREFPGVRFGPGEEALVAQEDGVIEAGDLVLALRTRLQSEGVTVKEGFPVKDLRDLDADRVVVAGGAWTAGLFERNGVRLPILNYRTQLSNIEIADAEGLPIVHDLTQHFYTRPESGSTILAGDGTQLRPFTPEDYNEAADPEFLESIAQRVVQRFEDGGEARMKRGWAGLCAGTPDRRPLVGPVPGLDDWFVLSGDNGFGLMRSLALGQRLGDAVRGKVDPSLDPRRFGEDPPRTFELREGYAVS
jgi:sarcosine oxidase subunit beta